MTTDLLDAYIVFIDYSKGFDNVDHHDLVTTLIHMGFPPHLAALIKSLYDNQNAKIRWNGSHTCPFNITEGVRQGCILSPTPSVYTLYTEQVMRDADSHQQGIKVGEKKSRTSGMQITQPSALNPTKRRQD